MLNGHYDAETKAYLLALQAGHKQDRPDIPDYWQEVVKGAEWDYLRSDGDGQVVRQRLVARCQSMPELAELLADSRPAPSLARVEEMPPAPDIVGTELQEALSQKDIAKVFEHSAEVAVLDDITLARFKMALRNIFGPTFPMRQFEELLRAEKRRLEMQNRPQPVIKSAHDLMNVVFEEKEWIVPGILPPGLIALAGKQKIGKSWLDYGLCLAVGGGGKAFGSVPCKGGDVLYLALEDNEQRLQSRFKQLLAPGEAMPLRIDFATEWPRMDAVGVASLEAWIQSKPNPKLIIIDPWVKVKPRVKARQGETGYDADYEALEGIKHLADQYQVCILVQFHMRKAGGEDPFDELNGTSGITACADGFLSLKRARGECDATLWGTGRDYKEDVDLALKFDSGQWNILGDAKEYALSKVSKEIIDILNQSEKPLYPKEIAKSLGIPEGTIRKRLFDMKARDEVKDTGQGYISLIPDSANSSNGGNEGNTGNVSNGGNAPVSVTAQVERYDDGENKVTAIRPDVEPGEQGSVTSVTPVTNVCNESTELHKEALRLLSEVQVLFNGRAGIRQMWRDDTNPSRQFLPDTYIKKVKAAIESRDVQSLQCAITAMKWTTGAKFPGRDKEEAPLQG